MFTRSVQEGDSPTHSFPCGVNKHTSNAKEANEDALNQWPIQSISFFLVVVLGRMGLVKVMGAWRIFRILDN